MKKIIGFLRDIQPTHYFVIFVLSLTLTAISGLSICRSFAGPSVTPTIFDGFPVYSVSIIGGENVSLSRESVIIHDSPDTLTQVYVYSSTSDFLWNFSAIASEGENESTPLMFAINWGKESKESIIVWAHVPYLGWCYSISKNSSVKTIRLNASFVFGSKYDISVDWRQLPDSITAFIKLSNSTWQESFMVEVASSPKERAYVSLSFQAWARRNASMKAEYLQSRFISYNGERYMANSGFGALALFFSTFVSICLSIVTFRKSHFSVLSALLQHLHRIINPKKLAGFMNSLFAFFSRHKCAVFLVLFFGVLRLVIAVSLYGHGFDLYTFRVWSLIIREKGVNAVFPFSDILPPYWGVRPTYFYPPIIMYVLTVLSVMLPLESMSNILFSFFVKIPIIVADLLIGVLTFVFVRKVGGDKVALFALALSLVNMLDSALWGQFDSVVVLFMIAAVWLVAADHIELGWVFAALALATKQVALPFLPALIVLSLKNRRFRSTVFGLMTFSLTLLLVWTPFVFGNYSVDFAFQNPGLGLLLPGGALSLSPEIPGTSIDAFNMWPLITYVRDDIPLKQGIRPPPGTPPLDDTLPNQLLGMSYYQLGLIIFLAFYVPVLLMIWKASDSSDVMMKFGLLMLTFFILPTRVHDRYLIFSIAFLPLAVATAKVVSIFYVVLAATFSLNLLYGLAAHVNPFNIPNQLGFMQTIFSDELILLIIITNIVVFMLFYSYCMKRSVTKTSVEKEG